MNVSFQGEGHTSLRVQASVCNDHLYFVLVHRELLLQPLRHFSLQRSYRHCGRSAIGAQLLWSSFPVFHEANHSRLLGQRPQILFIQSMVFCIKVASQAQLVKCRNKLINAIGIPGSNADVASSSRRSEGFLTKALAIAIRCFWPLGKAYRICRNNRLHKIVAEEKTTLTHLVPVRALQLAHGICSESFR